MQDREEDNGATAVPAGDSTAPAVAAHGTDHRTARGTADRTDHRTDHATAAVPCAHEAPDGDGTGDGTDGHVSHADDTCAASGTSGAPAPAAPARSALAPEPGPVGGASAPRDGETVRGPPSLSELQLLRI